MSIANTPRIGRRAAIAALALLVASGPAFAVSPAAPVSTSIAVPSRSMNYLNVFLAEEFLAKEGVKAQITAVDSGSRAAAALAGNSAQFAVLALNEIVNVVAQGQKVIAVAGLQNGNAIQVVVTKNVLEKKGVTPDSPLAQRIEALRGLKIAVTTPGSSTDQTLKYLLAQGKIDPAKGLDIINLNNPPAMLAALQRGQIDGFVHAPPNTTKAVQSHGGVALIDMIDTPATKGALFHVLAVKEDWAKANQETVLAVLRGFWKMQQFMASDRAGAEAMSAKIYSQTEPALFKSAFDAMYPSYAKTPIMSPASAQKTLEYLEATSGKRIAAAPPEKWVVNEYAEKAKP
jgi:NitT/TauT family transport system substrate-binding protein